MADALPPFWSMMIWGLAGTLAMTTILQGAQGMGLSRLSLPFLAGTFFVGDRRWAVIVGFVFYVIGGWIFAFLYFVLFASLSLFTWWFGAAVGVLHGVFLLVCGLPLLPFIHPRMAGSIDTCVTSTSPISRPASCPRTRSGPRYRCSGRPCARQAG